MPVTSVGDEYLTTTPFKISPKKFSYLGIWMTHDHKDLYKANYQPLLCNLRRDLNGGTLCLSLLEAE